MNLVITSINLVTRLIQVDLNWWVVTAVYAQNNNLHMFHWLTPRITYILPTAKAFQNKQQNTTNIIIYFIYIIINFIS